MLIRLSTLSPPSRRDDASDEPPSPFSFSYFGPLLLVILACGGFVWYRRSRRRGESGIPLSFAAGQPAGIRLSEDGPPTHTFTHDNASSDSLPSHALEDLPDLNKLPRPPLSTIYSTSSTSTTTSDLVSTSLPSTGLSKSGLGGIISSSSKRAPAGPAAGRAGTGGLVGGRRSMKARQGQIGIESSDSEGEDETAVDPGTRGQTGDPFGIGDDDDLSDSGGSHSGDDGDLGPLGRATR
ncbi:hypothetical protein I317_05180 [Kwoniella heveanensis CBS 569]|nr:hypothetical protein I317_05180 [Kwoniella heveanensis CBS 569]